MLVEVKGLGNSVSVSISVLVLVLVFVSVSTETVVEEVVEDSAEVEDVVRESLVVVASDEVVFLGVAVVVTVVEVVTLEDIEWLTVTVDRTTSVTGGIVTATVTVGASSAVEVSALPSTWTTE